jgi:hypothetical protein
MALLKEGKLLKRQIKLQTFQRLINVEINLHGIHFSVKGSKTKTFLPWALAISSSLTGDNVPASFFEKPMEFLQNMDFKLSKRKEKRDAIN